MAFVLQNSWSVVDGARPRHVRDRVDRGRRVFLGLLATVLIHVGLIAFLMLKLFEPSPGNGHSGSHDDRLTLIDLDPKGSTSTPAAAAPDARSSNASAASISETAPLITSEWQFVRFRVLAPATSGAPEPGPAAAPSDPAGNSAGGSGDGYDPYSNAGYFPTKEAQRAAMGLPGIRTLSSRVDPVSLEAVVRSFRQQHPGVRGTVSFVLRTAAAPTIESVTVTGGTLDRASADLLARMLQQSARIIAPSGQAVEAAAGPLTFG